MGLNLYRLKPADYAPGSIERQGSVGIQQMLVRQGIVGIQRMLGRQGVMEA